MHDKRLHDGSALPRGGVESATKGSYTRQPVDAENHEQMPDSTVVNKDSVVLLIAHWLGRIQHTLNGIFYRRLPGRFHDDRLSPYYNYLYVFCFWTPLLIAMAVASVWAHGGQWWLLAILPAWRWLEIAVWWLKLLVDKTHAKILSAERNLIFLLADSTAVVTATFVIWRTTEWTEPQVSWVNALATFTLNGPPPGLHHRLGDAVAIASAATGLVLVGAGLALLVGIVGQRIRVAPGEYTAVYPPEGVIDPPIGWGMSAVPSAPTVNALKEIAGFQGFPSGPGRTRTFDQRIMSPLL